MAPTSPSPRRPAPALLVLLLIAGLSTLAGVRAGASSGTTPTATPVASREAPRTARDERGVLADAERCTAHGQAIRTGAHIGRRVVALTFDDGPSSGTAAILRTLRRGHAHATFFVIGQRAHHRRALLRRMVRRGHAIGNHTWSHANVAKGDRAARDELALTSSVIRNAVGAAPCLIRPPFGAVGPGLQRVAAAEGMEVVTWDVDPRDWTGPGADAIAERALAAIHPGAIVLLHDGGAHPEQTLAALPRILKGLRSRGYETATVPELLHLRR